MENGQYRAKSFIWSSHRVIAQMLEEDSANSILDVGSGRGHLGQMLTYKPNDLCAIDRESSSLPEEYSLFWEKDLNSTDFTFLEGKTFQVIVLADVVEHLKNPNGVVLQLMKHLQENGIMVFSFPNMGFFLARIFTAFRIRPKMERGLYDKTHLHDFDRASAHRFLENQKLKILEIRVTPVPLPLFSHLFKKGAILFFVYKIANWLAQKFPSLFGYQFIFKTKCNEI